MRGRIGVELDGGSLRAVRLDARGAPGARTLEVSWDPDDPVEGARLLREGLGRAARVTLAVRLPLLHVKRVRMPPMPPAERRKALRLEPQRYFPVRLEELVVAVRDDDLVFAAREEAVASWIGAMEALGPVDRVEPGPVALARALRSAGILDAVVTQDYGARGTGVLDLREAALAGVRRLYGAPEEAAGAFGEGGERRRPLPDSGPVPEPFLTAYGAALAGEEGLDATLLPDEQRERIVRRRRRSLAIAVAAAAASLGFMLASLDAWRARAVDRLAGEVTALEERAKPALALQEQIALLDRRAGGIGEIAAGRPDPLQALLAVTRRLPPGAYLQSLRYSGGEWQAEGFAPHAAQVTQALGSAPELSGVRVLGATSRARTGRGTHESFALAFRLARRP